MARRRCDKGECMRFDLENRVARLEELLHECLEDYGHRNFTDRHGMADRLRAALNVETTEK